MNPSRKFDMQLETLVLSGYLKHFYEREPLAVRELLIQNQKLQRLLTAKESPGVGVRAILGGGSANKLAKQRGRRERALGEQRKKVRKMLEEFIQTKYRERNPSSSKRQVRELVEQIKEAIEDGVKRVKQQLIFAPPKVSRPFGRIGARAKFTI